MELEYSDEMILGVLENLRDDGNKKITDPVIPRESAPLFLRPESQSSKPVINQPTAPVKKAIKASAFNWDAVIAGIDQEGEAPIKSEDSTGTESYWLDNWMGFDYVSSSIDPRYLEDAFLPSGSEVISEIASIHEIHGIIDSLLEQASSQSVYQEPDKIRRAS
ncbi:MAG: hypothetical protein LBH87_02245 [Coriobacteriales bacterium]|nr:hypothetical protein [Coriobacteriales bacterium]